MSRVGIRELRFGSLSIPFKVAFRHASAERSQTSSVWIEAAADNGTVGHGESCPRPYVTRETLETAQVFVSTHEASLRAQVSDMVSLVAWMDRHGDELNENPAAWCAIEMAILNLLSVADRVPIEVFLGIPPLAGRFQYSAVIGDMSPDAFRLMAERYRRLGFKDFKIKLSGNLERDRAKLDVLRESDGLADLRVRADANNLWRTAGDAVRFLEALECPLFAVEEPIGPCEYPELARIGSNVGCKVILDESFVRVSQIDHVTADPDRWLINLRVSKMGGLLRSLAVVDAARAAHVGLIVGAQVGETSLLTRAGLTVAHASRDILVAQEGAFGTFLLERDVCEPSLMFGAAGVLDVASYPALERPGFGLAVSGRAV